MAPAVHDRFVTNSSKTTLARGCNEDFVSRFLFFSEAPYYNSNVFLLTSSDLSPTLKHSRGLAVRDLLYHNVMKIRHLATAWMHRI